jgi:hypothetical protein
MPFDRDNPLRVRAEAVGKAPKLWAWAIYRGSDRFLITRSRPDYYERANALEAGLKAAGDIGRRLRTEVVVEDTNRIHSEAPPEWTSRS